MMYVFKIRSLLVEKTNTKRPTYFHVALKCSVLLILTIADATVDCNLIRSDLSLHTE